MKLLIECLNPLQVVNVIEAWGMKHSYLSLKPHLSYSPVLWTEARALCILSKFSVAEMHPQPPSVCPDPSLVLLNVKS